MSDSYIISNDGLKKIIDLAYKRKILAVDTEFTREKTYYPILSLIQIAVGDEVFVVDCLQNIDLTPIYKMIIDDQIKKILYSSTQDLQIFYQKSLQIPTKIVDVQVMANFCGFGFNNGYSNLVENLFGVAIDKKLQRSDWQRRPLDLNQIEYAKKDVLYLEESYQKLYEILNQKKRLKWFEEEMKDFTYKSVVRSDESLFKNFVTQKKFSHKNQQQKAKIRELILWREKSAQALDMPRQHFLQDSMIEEIVMKEKLDLRLDKYMIEEIKNILFKKYNENELSIKEEKNIIMNEKQKLQYQRAKAMIAKIASDEDLKEQFLVSSPTLKNIILGYKKVNEIILGWRYFLFGKKLEKIIEQ